MLLYTDSIPEGHRIYCDKAISRQERIIRRQMSISNLQKVINCHYDYMGLEKA